MDDLRKLIEEEQVLCGAINIDTLAQVEDDIRHYATRTGSLLNQSANIEAGLDITILANEIVNKKREFAVGHTEMTTSHDVPYTNYVGDNTHWLLTETYYDLLNSPYLFDGH